MMVVIILIFCGLLSVVFAFNCVWRFRKRKIPPGPEGYLCCGNSFQIDSNRFHHNLKQFHNEFGQIVRLKLYGTSVISLSSAFLIKLAFGTCPNEEYTNDRSENSTSGIFYGRKHIGCANLSPFTQMLRDFHSKGVSLYVENLQHFELCIRKEIKQLHLNLISNPNSDVNPHQVLRKYFANLTSILLLGEPLPDSDPDKECPWEFVDLVFELIEPGVDGALRSFPLLKYLPGYHGNVYRRTIAARDKVAKRFFEDQKVSYSPTRIRGLVDVCLMRQQQDVAETGDTWLTDDYIKGLIGDTLVAGMTELLKTVRLFMLLMCHHQDVQTRLQADLDSIIGTERFPVISDRKWMPYTEAVIMEVLRYGSQTPLAIPHKCNRSVTLGGYHIEAGSVILPNLYAVHHDEHIWGDPWNFRPDRYLDALGNLLPADHKFMCNVIPFSAGKRACPGEDFARSRLFITVTSLLQRVGIMPPENTELPSADPRDYTKKYPLSDPQFSCRIVSRENIVL